MVRADVIGLVTEVNSAHGVHETITESVREVLAEIRSVSRSEYYNALNAGVQPEVIAVIGGWKDTKVLMKIYAKMREKTVIAAVNDVEHKIV